LVALGALAAVAAAIVVIVVVINGSSPSIGHDVSFPQCSGSLPSNALFGIVGVNGGLANNANPCLDGELRWARATAGQRRPAQPALSLYIDTGNPGAHHVPDWPRAGRARSYGDCNGRLTNACSYLYGKQRAAHSYRLVARLDPVAARSAPWWLDVELMASWAGTYQLNIAALRGFIDGLRSAGARGRIGIYSTSAQWKDITGLTAATTTRAFGARLAAWVAGTQATLAQARRNCANGGFTGVPPTLAQYRVGTADADLRCSDNP
jgi:hypothetical protein